MSVLIADFKAFNAIRNAMVYAFYNNVCNEKYSYVVQQALRNTPDPDQECTRIVQSWIDLNEKSYDFNYNEEQTDDIRLNQLFKVDRGITVHPVQLFKFLQCLLNNIHVNKRIEESSTPGRFKECYFFDNKVKLTPQEQTDYKLLVEYQQEVANNLVMQLLPEYKKASWCGDDNKVLLA